MNTRLTIHCPVCRWHIQQPKYFGAYIQCPSCHCLFVEHPPFEKVRTKGLQNWAEQVSRNSIQFEISPDIVHRVELLKTYGKKTHARLIDVGCGKGDFLVYAKNNGFDVIGMDIISPFIPQLKKQGIPVVSKLSSIADESYDIVTCFDVIEHTVNPQQLLEECYRILKPDGIVFFTTPNGSSISKRILKNHWWVLNPEGHYVLFTPNALTLCLKKISLNCIEMKTNTFTQWFQPSHTFCNKVLNKIVYLFFFPFLPKIFSLNLGDNIEVVAKKVTR
jgi:2-polyprenyl-3-methyl-5-hydroxy-6-metoxy-1,4-benzoquinol methylase